jgi:hypothetical protein
MVLGGTGSLSMGQHRVMALECVVRAVGNR